MIELIDIVLLTLLVATTVALLRIRNLFAVVMLFSIFSLLAASVYVVVDAVDVALTEAAVGAGISTILMLATLALVGHGQRVPAGPRRPLVALAVVTMTGAALLWATLDMPRFGDPDAPAHRHVAPRYIEDSPTEIGIPNVVASVLASYRGYEVHACDVWCQGIVLLEALKILEGYGLVHSRKTGRVRTYQLVPKRLQLAEDWLAKQRTFWTTRLDQLDSYLMELKEKNT